MSAKTLAAAGGDALGSRPAARETEMADATTFDLSETYVELREGGRAKAIPATDDFWPDVVAGRRPIDGRLVTAARYTDDWDYWEMHPAGEELLVLLSGAIDVILDQGGVRRTAAMRAGDALLVPRGAWHRAEVQAPGAMLHVTWGEGTEHCPR